MTTTLQRLLKHPHSAVFDKAPGAELALRLRHEDGATWEIAEEVLSVTVGDVTWEYDLSQHTIGSLAEALEADGFEILALSSSLSSRGAAALIEGSGDQHKSNGDHLYAYTSLLWAILGGYAVEAREAKRQVSEALRQMVITTAEGEWLDLWGMLYAVGRSEGEDDADYAPRIPEEAFRLRVNAFAIEKAIKDITGKTVEIREPWRQMFTLNESSLSGVDHLPDNKYYSYFTIHPVARESIDWTDVLDVVHRNRPAGVDVYFPYVEFPVRHVNTQPPAEYAVSMGGLFIHSMASWNSSEAPLGVMRLSDNEITMNHPVVVFNVVSLSNKTGLEMGVEEADLLNVDFVLNTSRLAYIPEKIVHPRNVAYASICLSDGVPLGDENAILSRGGVSYYSEPPETLSDEMAPSDYDVVKNVHLVERIMLIEHASGPIEYDGPEGVSLAMREEML